MANNDRLLVQLASYNTNLQGENGVPQDLVEWLAPTLQVSTFLSHEHRAPDIFAVGFQELLPLYLGLPGFSQKVLDSRNKLILSELEKHAPNKERYTLVSKIANVGVALLVYVRDEKLANRVVDVQTQWTGCGFGGYMGNKGAVGIRFRVQGENGLVGETFTFVCAHLTPHEHNLKARLRDWRHIVGTLLFPPVSESSSRLSTIYDTSHLFVFGDMNFRVALPADHQHKQASRTPEFADILENHAERENIKEHDQLLIERRKGNVFVGLREGNFWNFKCSYKYHPGEVDAYSSKRAPSWTDRIMYTTYTDDPDQPDSSTITNVLYTSIPSYTISDHKPVVAIVMLPPSQPITGSSPPLLRLPASYTPKPYTRATLMRYTGRAMDRVIGSLLFLLTLVGAGNAIIGIANFIGGLGAFAWWRSTGRVSLV